jgi:hypothetical protein
MSGEVSFLKSAEAVIKGWVAETNRAEYVMWSLGQGMCNLEMFYILTYIFHHP